MNTIVLVCATTILLLSATHTKTMEPQDLVEKAEKIHCTSAKSGKKIAESLKHRGEQSNLKTICVLKYGIKSSKVKFNCDKTEKLQYFAMSLFETAPDKINTTEKVKVKVDSNGIHFSLKESPQEIIYSHKPCDWVPAAKATEITYSKNHIIVTGSDGAYCHPKPKGYAYFVPSFDQYLEQKPKTFLEKVWIALSKGGKSQTIM